MIVVKVTKTPGPVSEFSLETGATVGNALNLAGITSTDGFRVEVAGESRNLSDEIFNGDLVMVVKQIKGNS